MKAKNKIIEASCAVVTRIKSYCCVIVGFALILGLLATGCKTDVVEEPVVFADADLLAALCKQGADANGDGMISVKEAATVTRITLLGENITGFGGLEAFVNLDSLVLKMLPPESLDLSGNPQLDYLEISQCEIKKLDLSGNSNLVTVLCEKNQLETLVLPVSPVLKTLNCGYNRLRSIDVSGNPALTSLRCNNNLLTTLDLSKNKSLLQMVSCGNQLTSLDVSENKLLTLLGVDNMPMLAVVYVWTVPFPPSGVKVLMDFSPQVQFELPNQ